MENVLTDILSPDGTGEGVATQNDETFGMLTGESGATVSFQDGSNRLDAGVYTLIREDVLLEQGVNGWVMELGAWESLADGWIVGPQQSAQLVFLAVELSGQVAGGAGTETSSEQVGVLR